MDLYISYRKHAQDGWITIHPHGRGRRGEKDYRRIFIDDDGNIQKGMFKGTNIKDLRKTAKKATEEKASPSQRLSKASNDAQKITDDLVGEKGFGGLEVGKKELAKVLKDAPVGFTAAYIGWDGNKNYYKKIGANEYEQTEIDSSGKTVYEHRTNKETVYSLDVNEVISSYIASAASSGYALVFGEKDDCAKRLSKMATDVWKTSTELSDAIFDLEGGSKSKKDATNEIKDLIDNAPIGFKFGVVGQHSVETSNGAIVTTAFKKISKQKWMAEQYDKDGGLVATSNISHKELMKGMPSIVASMSGNYVYSGNDSGAYEEMNNILEYLSSLIKEKEKAKAAKQTGTAKTKKQQKQQANKNHLTAEQMASQKAKAQATLTPEAKKAREESTRSDVAIDADLRKKAGEIWKSLPKQAKESLYKYTDYSDTINNGLRNEGLQPENKRGKHDDWMYDTDRMTKAIEKSSYDKDLYLYRGIKTSAAAKLFNDSGVTESEIKEAINTGDVSILKQKLVGKSCVEKAFASCGSKLGRGFNKRPVQLEIFAPKGTKLIYAEPWSAFGYGAKDDWDGVSKQSTFGQEFETLIQRGTKFKIKGLYVENSQLRILVDVEEQI